MRHIDHKGKKPSANVDAVLGEFAKVVAKAGVKMPGAFYVFRHIHRTVSDGAKDKRAADAIMGYVDGSMAAHYVEGIADERLVAVTDRVRAWLMAGKPGTRRRGRSGAVAETGPDILKLREDAG